LNWLFVISSGVLFSIFFFIKTNGRGSVK
jgi:hypothetical protein